MAWKLPILEELKTKITSAWVKELVTKEEESSIAELNAGLATRVTKAEAETIATAAAQKEAVESAQAVATVNIASLSGIPSKTLTDEVTLVAGQILLLTKQSTESQNGLWKVESGAWVRPVGFAHASSQFGVYVPVLTGATQSGAIWLLKNSSTVIVDTTAQEWIVNSAGSGVSTLIGTTTAAVTAVGQNAAKNSGTSLQIVAIGTNALEANLTGLYSTAVGYNAAKSNQYSTSETAVGWEALAAHEALKTDTEANLGGANVAIGAVAMRQLRKPVYKSYAPKATLSSKKIELATSKALGFTNETPVRFSALTSGITGLSTGTLYYVVGEETAQFEVATAPKGTGIAVGGHAMEAATTTIELVKEGTETAEQNAVVGNAAFKCTPTGSFNAGIGFGAGEEGIRTYGNCFLGTGSGKGAMLPENNVAVGLNSMECRSGRAPNTKPTSEVEATEGSFTLKAVTTGFPSSGYLVTTGPGGPQILMSYSGSNASEFTGVKAIFYITGLASKALTTSTTIYYASNPKENVCIGTLTGWNLTTGSANVVAGFQCGVGLTTGKENVLLGNRAGEALTTGEGNIFIGASAGEKLAAGTNYKLFIGDSAAMPIIQGKMNPTAAENELGLGTSGGKIGFLAKAATPIAAAAAGAETTAAIWTRLKELGLVL